MTVYRGGPQLRPPAGCGCALTKLIRGTGVEALNQWSGASPFLKKKERQPRAVRVPLRGDARRPDAIARHGQ